MKTQMIHNMLFLLLLEDSPQLEHIIMNSQNQFFL